MSAQWFEQVQKAMRPTECPQESWNVVTINLGYLVVKSLRPSNPWNAYS